MVTMAELTKQYPLDMRFIELIAGNKGKYRPHQPGQRPLLQRM